MLFRTTPPHWLLPYEKTAGTPPTQTCFHICPFFSYHLPSPNQDWPCWCARVIKRIQSRSALRDGFWGNKSNRLPMPSTPMELVILPVLWVLFQDNKAFKNRRNRNISAQEEKGPLLQKPEKNGPRSSTLEGKNFLLLCCKFRSISSSQKNWCWVGLEASYGLRPTSLANNIHSLTHPYRYGQRF